MACFDEVSSSCISVEPATPFSQLSGESLDELLVSIDQKLAALSGKLSTTTLVRKSLDPPALGSLPTLLQALIDLLDAHSTQLAGLQTKTAVGYLLDQPTSIGDGSSVKSLLSSLVSKVSSLQADVASLKASQVASTTLYVPHY